MSSTPPPEDLPKTQRSITETKIFRRIAVQREQWVVLNGATMAEISNYYPLIVCL